MKRRSLVLVSVLSAAAGAPFLVFGEASAQSTVKDRLAPSGVRLTPQVRTLSTARVSPAQAAASGTPAPQAAATAHAPAADADDAASAHDGKARGDTSDLSQFESAVEFEPRRPGERVQFSLEEADLTELVRVIAQLTGKRFIFGGKVKNIKASVYSPQKVTVAEAYQAFLSILETNGLTVVPQGRFLKIIETGGVTSSTTPVYGTAQGSPAEDRYVTRMHRLGHISADDAATVLTKFKSKEADITVYGPTNMIIVTDTGTNIRRMMTILDEIDVGASGDQIFIEPIHYAAASDVEKSINDLFDIKAGSTPAPATKGSPAPSAAPVSDVHVTKVLADERSNSLIIVATERAYLRVLELIKRLDTPQTGEGEIHVLPLQHADATELVKTLNEIVGGGTSGGATPASGRRGAQQQSAQSEPASGIFEGTIKVSADKATNSIVVTSSRRDYAALRAVIDRLDMARRQVFIEAVIMDLQLKRSNELGVSFHGGAPFTTDTSDDSLLYGGNKMLNTISPTPDPTALQGFALGVRGPGIPGSQNLLGTGISIPAFGTFIQAIAKTGDSDLLSTPHILALDNEDAEINVGDNIPLQTNAVSAFPGLNAAGAAAGALGTMGSFGSFGSPRQDVGTKIKIKPHLNDSNEVRLDITEEISEQGAPLGGTLGAIPISKRTATTKLVVADQQTVVIGGLIRNVTSRSEEKIPVLGDIPVLGALFRKRTNTKEKRNLVLILTPYIIRSQDDLRTVFERKMQERQEYLDKYFVFSDSSEYTPPKDWARTNGLVEDIRQAYFQVDEKRRLQELMKPRDAMKHDPQRPIEMPQDVRGGESPGAATPAQGNAQPAARAPAQGALKVPLNIRTPVRSVETAQP